MDSNEKGALIGCIGAIIAAIITAIVGPIIVNSCTHPNLPINQTPTSIPTSNPNQQPPPPAANTNLPLTLECVSCPDNLAVELKSVTTDTSTGAYDTDLSFSITDNMNINCSNGITMKISTYVNGEILYPVNGSPSQNLYPGQTVEVDNDFQNLRHGSYNFMTSTEYDCYNDGRNTD